MLTPARRLTARQQARAPRMYDHLSYRHRDLRRRHLREAPGMAFASMLKALRSSPMRFFIALDKSRGVAAWLTRTSFFQAP